MWAELYPRRLKNATGSSLGIALRDITFSGSNITINTLLRICLKKLRILL
jgi:hypothetical protein